VVEVVDVADVADGPDEEAVPVVAVAPPEPPEPVEPLLVVAPAPAPPAPDVAASTTTFPPQAARPPPNPDAIVAAQSKRLRMHASLLDCGPRDGCETIRAMSVALIIILSLLGGLALAGGIVYAVTAAVRRAITAEVAELTREEIVLDSGKVTLDATFEDFRGPMVYIGSGWRRGPTRVVLTKRRFAFVPSGQNRFGFARVEREELSRFEVGVRDGKLHLHTTHPPHGKGTVDLVLSVADPASWVRALKEAGAR
jgi:hypothetical protein